MNEAKEKILAEVAKAFPYEDCLWLPGDASNRYYGRLVLKNAPTKMLMVMNAPEAFKSEEVTGAKESSELPFARVGRLFLKGGICVPQMIYLDPEYRFLITEDFGDELLYVRRQQEPALEWYKKSLDELMKIQSLEKFGTAKFTEELFRWEFHHFLEYAIEKRQKNLSASAKKSLLEFFDSTVRSLFASRYVMVHRDFHSKNLLVLEANKKIGVIDFQDALMGPVSYDLASLLRDSYVTLSDEEEKELLKYFREHSSLSLDQELYELTSLQRNMKAVGRFFYISMVKKKDTHLPYVKPSLQRIFKTLVSLKEIEILEILQECLEGDYE